MLENGGNDPLIVDEGVDPAWAAGQAALGAFANAGQICVSVERIYCHAAIADPFLAALTAEGVAWADRLGPLVDRRQREHVHGQVAEALAAGARAWRALPVGTVKVNAVFGGAPGGAAQPRRGSGSGFGYGPELLDEMTTVKVVHLAPPPGA